MNESFLKKNEFDETRSITIDLEDYKVYAYYIHNDECNGHLWLFNLISIDDNYSWENKENMPFFNKNSFIEKNVHDSIINKFDIKKIRVEWDTTIHVNDCPIANIFYEEILIGLLYNGGTGYSTMVLKDGPLAKKYHINWLNDIVEQE